jgi:hypothetical protein
MNGIWRKYGILLAALAVVSCNHIEPAYNVSNDAVPHAAQQQYSAEQIGDMIAKVAAGKGWVVDRTEPGRLHITLKWNNHSATAGVDTAVSCLDTCKPDSITSSADITYTQDNYSIQIEPAQNANQPDGMTYRRYNRYIQQLQAAIDKRLSEAAYK